MGLFCLRYTELLEAIGMSLSKIGKFSAIISSNIFLALTLLLHVSCDRSNLMTSFSLSHLLTAPFPNPVPLGLELQCVNLRDAVQSTAVSKEDWGVAFESVCGGRSVWCADGAERL